jgi:uncharacterized damage-inducible protein DinB
MSELEQILIGDSAATAPNVILEGLAGEAAHKVIKGAPHTIYQELWHITFWQQVTLDWVDGIETPFPTHAAAGFPTAIDTRGENWEQLCQRFFDGSQLAAAVARDKSRLEQPICCPSRPGSPVRIMTVREQLESLGAHNAYHLGRIVLLRQLIGTWPPPSGGYSW